MILVKVKSVGCNPLATVEAAAIVVALVTGVRDLVKTSFRVRCAGNTVTTNPVISALRVTVAAHSASSAPVFTADVDFQATASTIREPIDGPWTTEAPHLDPTAIALDSVAVRLVHRITCYLPVGCRTAWEEVWQISLLFSGL